MKYESLVLEIQSRKKIELIDITGNIHRTLNTISASEGILVIFSPHTTAGVTINENADPAVRSDMEKFLERRFPPEIYFEHGEGNSPAHILSSLISPSLSVIVEKGRMMLGTWQAVYFCEFDGPRRRHVRLKFIPA